MLFNALANGFVCEDYALFEGKEQLPQVVEIEGPRRQFGLNLDAGVT